MRQSILISFVLLLLHGVALGAEELPRATKSQAVAAKPSTHAQTPASELPEISYLHASGEVVCGGRSVHGSCTLLVEEGALVTLQVVRSLPGLLTATIERFDKEPDGLKRSDFEKLTGGVSGGGAQRDTATGAEVGFQTCPSSCASAFGCYREIRDEVSALQRAISNDLASYPTAICRLRGADAGLKKLLENTDPDDEDAFQDAFFQQLSNEQAASIGEAAFIEFWKKLRLLLAKAPDQLGSFPIYQADYNDRDFDLTWKFESMSELIEAPEQAGRAQIRLRDGWGVSTSTALMVSGLADDEYTTTSHTSTVGEEEVAIRKAVREDRDFASPEIAFLVSLGQKNARRNVFSVGVGLGKDTSGRLYGTWGHRLGQAGAFHVGVAVGRVKRLSKNIDVEDLGDADPNAARRDVFRPSITIGLSWRILD